jgi:hypothetical protein
MYFSARAPGRSTAAGATYVRLPAHSPDLRQQAGPQNDENPAICRAFAQRAREDSNL